MSAYEKAGKTTKYFRPNKDENVLIVNNHASFHELMQKKVDVIDGICYG